MFYDICGAANFIEFNRKEVELKCSIPDYSCIFEFIQFQYMRQFRPIEILLIEVVIYLLLWLFNDYLATLLSIILGTICLLILLISLIVEAIERSKVPRWYYIFLAMSVIAPIAAAIIYIVISGGLDWMKN